MALQAIGSFSMCSGHLTGMVVIGFSGHIRLMVSEGAEGSVMSIHTSRVICVGRVSSWSCVAVESSWILYWLHS